MLLAGRSHVGGAGGRAGPAVAPSGRSCGGGGRAGRREGRGRGCRPLPCLGREGGRGMGVAPGKKYILYFSFLFYFKFFGIYIQYKSP